MKKMVSRYHFKKQAYFYPKSVSHFLEMGSAIKHFMELFEQAETVFEVANTLWGLIENHWKFPKGIDQNVNNLKRKRDQLNGQKERTESRIKSELRPRKKVKKLICGLKLFKL
ncbi:uncharacterized protein [Gossypium hirsutum]|uniref:Uncharacterized protein isoform X2 n=4 Tax=Gossypium TaxID=3633 RepID=A0ABM2YZM9_GOSHI|nr:uncharacterized protein LOC107886721 isoform X2 [Gossypium hirsutum]